MGISDFCRSAIGFVVVVALFAGCDNRATSVVVPPASDGTAVPRSAERGIYVVIGSSSAIRLYGYRIKNGRLQFHPCSIKGVSYFLNVAVDALGDAMVPDPSTNAVTVFQGPNMCGANLGSIRDPYGQPYLAVSNDAITGIVAVSHVSGGVISICRLSTLDCAATLTNPNIVGVTGIAMANNGDCWASGFNNSSGSSVLIYFKRCSGRGEVASGFEIADFGGLAIDGHGNIVAINFGNSGSSNVYTYKGCDPHCTLIAGPLWLMSNEDQGSFNRDSTIFAAAGTNTRSEINFYGYSPTKITYLYSYKTNYAGWAISTAYNPRSKQ